MAVLRRFSAGRLKVAQLLLLLLVAVLGAPDTEIEKVLSSLRTAFRKVFAAKCCSAPERTAASRFPQREAAASSRTRYRGGRSGNNGPSVHGNRRSTRGIFRCSPRLAAHIHGLRGRTCL